MSAVFSFDFGDEELLLAESEKLRCSVIGRHNRSSCCQTRLIVSILFRLQRLFQAVAGLTSRRNLENVYLNYALS